jgi:integrase
MVLCPLSAMINVAHQHGLCPPIRIKRFKVKDERIARPIDEKWLRQFMQHAEPHLAAFALFAFQTGARPNECCNLRPEMLDLEQGVGISDSTKNGKRRRYYLTPEMVSRLRNLPPVLIQQGRHAGEYRVLKYAHPQSLRRPWKRACKAAGLDYRDRYEAGRHSCFTELVTRHGVDPVTAAQIGNATPQIVLRHYAKAETPQQTAMEVFDKKLTKRNRGKLKVA